jgi:hypothetical protein
MIKHLKSEKLRWTKVSYLSDKNLSEIEKEISNINSLQPNYNMNFREEILKRDLDIFNFIISQAFKQPVVKSVFNGKKLKVLVDGRALQNNNYRFRGIGRYASQLIEELQQDSKFEIFIFQDKELDHVIFENVKYVNSFWDSNINEIDIFIAISPITESMFDFLKIILGKDVITYAIVYDFIPMEYPNFYLNNYESRTTYLSNLKILNLFDNFLCISQKTLNNAKLIFGNNKKYHVIKLPFQYNGGLSPIKTSILVMSGNDLRKLPLQSIYIAQMIRRRTKLKIASLGITDEFLENNNQNAKNLIPFFLRGVELHNNLDEASKEELIRNAKYVVVSSVSEGLSLPVIEALKFGAIPVISDISSHREILGPNYVMFKNFKMRSIRKTIAKLVKKRHLSITSTNVFSTDVNSNIIDVIYSSHLMNKNRPTNG